MPTLSLAVRSRFRFTPASEKVANIERTSSVSWTNGRYSIALRRTAGAARRARLRALGLRGLVCGSGDDLRPNQPKRDMELLQRGNSRRAYGDGASKGGPSAVGGELEFSELGLTTRGG